MSIRILVFSTPPCANCKPLKEALTRSGLAFEDINCFETDNFPLMKEFDVRSVPTTVLIDEEGYRRTVAGNKSAEILAAYASRLRELGV